MIMAMIAAMNEELEKDGPNANILKERGRLKMLAGDKTGAMEALRQAVSLDPTSVDSITGEFKK